jgi:hypothetical protein
MRPVTEAEIRSSFVNCSKGAARRLAVPRDLVDRPWADLDFLGWVDPAARDRAYLVADLGDRLVGVTLRVAQGQGRRSMCALCLTTHSGGGTSLMTARKAGKAGQLGNSVGALICTDLACSLYLRGKKDPGPGGRLRESLTVEEQVERLTGDLTTFLARVGS